MDEILRSISDKGGLLGYLALAILGGWWFIKSLPTISSNLTGLAAANRIHNSMLDVLRQERDAAVDRADRAEERHDSLLREWAEMRSKFDSIQLELKSANSLIDNLRDQLKEATQQVAEINGRVKQTNQSISQVHQDVANLTDQIRGR